MIRNFKNFYEDAYVKDLTQIPFKVAYIFKDPDAIYWALSKRFTDVLVGNQLKFNDQVTKIC